jgi:hypothetical protein
MLRQLPLGRLNLPQEQPEIVDIAKAAVYSVAYIWLKMKWLVGSGKSRNFWFLLAIIDF